MGKKKQKPDGHPDHEHDPEELVEMREFGHELFHDIFDELNHVNLCGDLAAEALKSAIAHLVSNGYMTLHGLDPAYADRWLAETLAEAAQHVKGSGVDLSVAMIRKTP